MSTTAGAFGIVASRSATASPSRSGRWMSSRTISGRRTTTASTAPAPSAASPTTSKPSAGRCSRPRPESRMVIDDQHGWTHVIDRPTASRGSHCGHHQSFRPGAAKAVRSVDGPGNAHHAQQGGAVQDCSQPQSDGRRDCGQPRCSARPSGPALALEAAGHVTKGGGLRCPRGNHHQRDAAAAGQSSEPCDRNLRPPPKPAHHQAPLACPGTRWTRRRTTMWHVLASALRGRVRRSRHALSTVVIDLGCKSLGGGQV
jgi:hypothetical protein